MNGHGTDLSLNPVRRRPRSLGPRSLLLALASTFLLVGGFASAQLLADVATTAAISASFDSSIRLPSGSYRVVGEAPPSLVSKVRDGSGYGGWEAYTASGLATRLFPAHLQQLTTSFAVAGYWEQGRSEHRQGGERHVRYEFAGDMGGSVLLYVIETDSQLVWLIGKRD